MDNTIKDLEETWCDKKWFKLAKDTVQWDSLMTKVIKFYGLSSVYVPVGETEIRRLENRNTDDE